MLTVATAPRRATPRMRCWRATASPSPIIGDSVGFIAQRVIATIVNIAANIAQRGIAAVDDLEAAVRLGLGYPVGPLAWGDRIGGPVILEILRGQLSATGDPRYRPSPGSRAASRSASLC